MVFKDQGGGLINEQAAQEALQRTQSVITNIGIARDSLLFEYKYALKGFSAKLTPQQVEKLKNDARVDHVSQAQMFHVGRKGWRGNKKATASEASSATTSSSQTIPWGVSRVGGPLDGTGKKAWIIDSGIDLDHPDLNVDTGNSASFIANETADDNFGHGTYVAGILAAKDNSQDVVGVAAGAQVVSVNVCDGTGHCPEPGYLNGIDYVSNKAAPSDIVNISIWGPVNSDVDNAVINAANNGVRLVLIAGNGADDANNYSPGRVEHSNIWTVSAYDDTDAFAVSFSNYGNPPIEYGGPGVDVPSLHIGGGWGMGFGGQGSEDGTSYAAPHIAGLLLAAPYGIETDGTVSGDPDGDPDAIAINEEPLQVYVSGPSLVNDGDMASFSASVSHQEGSVSYQWYYRTSPSDPWVLDSGSTSSTYSRTFHNPGGYEDQAVKAVVNSAGESASDVHAVTVRSCSQTTPTSNGTVKPNDIDPCD